MGIFHVVGSVRNGIRRRMGNIPNVDSRFEEYYVTMTKWPSSTHVQEPNNRHNNYNNNK